MADNKEILKFKTTLNCGGCVSKVAPALDGAEGVVSWDVDTEHPDKVLSVHSGGATADQVIQLVKSKGFQAESVG